MGLVPLFYQGFKKNRRRRLKPRLQKRIPPPRNEEINEENNVIFTAHSSTRGGGFCLYRRGFNRRLHLRISEPKEYVSEALEEDRPIRHFQPKLPAAPTDPQPKYPLNQDFHSYQLDVCRTHSQSTSEYPKT